MKKTIATAFVAGILATGTAFAQSGPVSNATVEDFYRTVETPVPTTQRVCYDVQVQNNNGVADTAIGAIIGGAIGRQFGNGSGRDASTVLGAIVGSQVARNNGQANSGSRIQTRCENQTTYTYTTQRVYDYSVITFVQDNQTHRVRFIK